MSIIKVEGRGEYERVHQLGNSLPHTYLYARTYPELVIFRTGRCEVALRDGKIRNYF